MKVKATQSCPTLCAPMDYTIHGILQARILKWVAFHSPGDLPNPGIEPRFPTLQVDSLPAEPQGKPKNTGVGSLSLHQQIFPTQELNWGLLHCRQILKQLTHKRSPRILGWVAYPFSSRSSHPRNPIRVSSITGGFFTNQAIREAPEINLTKEKKRKG